MKVKIFVKSLYHIFKITYDFFDSNLIKRDTFHLSFRFKTRFDINNAIHQNFFTHENYSRMTKIRHFILSKIFSNENSKFIINEEHKAILHENFYVYISLCLQYSNFIDFVLWL